MRIFLVCLEISLPPRQGHFRFMFEHTSVMYRKQVAELFNIKVIDRSKIIFYLAILNIKASTNLLFETIPEILML